MKKTLVRLKKVESFALISKPIIPLKLVLHYNLIMKLNLANTISL